ncbi:MAG: hypothetical protein AVDCRST_MAG90-916 [uncultured Microvirga sp.]|uniref:Uncharacterized protein n=1 Tax=uncultured Microvirga sp. TaxID=412392 RepID=A0A6J4KYP4_9HYPH|nr:MAG: hypothetical protein AVDCRST_MAG90-916 [uncultured Microvirga sp.]
MPKLLSKILIVPAATALVLGAAALTPATAQGARGSMEQCVNRVLTGLLRAKTPAAQAGRAVVQQCDSQLRATLQAAIQSGEAGACTVESCLAIARERAAEEATQAYSQQLGR